MSVEYSLVHRVQFSETDMAGVVHFSQYFRMMEEVEHAFYRAKGLSVAIRVDGMEIGWPRVSASCDFFAPLRFEDEVELHLRISKVGQKSFSYEVEFTCRGQRIALGKATSVCCRLTPDGMSAIAIPPSVREKLTGRHHVEA